MEYLVPWKIQVSGGSGYDSFDDLPKARPIFEFVIQFKVVDTYLFALFKLYQKYVLCTEFKVL